MRITILSNLSYQIIPETENMVEVDETLLQRIGIDKQFDENGNIIDYVREKTKEEQIEELKQKLAETDYVCLKFVDGEITQAEYAETWKKRKQWREEINKLEKEI